VQTSEGAKFWLGVFTELRNRGLKDALIVCCDGLPGLPDAIETVWPQDAAIKLLYSRFATSTPNEAAT
jgi:transposase-like protein